MKTKSVALLIGLSLALTVHAEVAERMPDTLALTNPALAESSESVFDGAAIDVVSSRDSDGIKRTATRAGGAVNYHSIHDFVAVGASTDYFRQGNWSLRVDSLTTQIRKVNPATGEGYTARAALAFKGGKTELHGEGVWNIRFSQTTGGELIVNRDAIETPLALQQSLMANFFAVSVDHAVNDRLTVIGMPTYRHFEDGNEQFGVRGWLIYNLIPEQGLSVNLKARSYESSGNGRGIYFSPSTYQRAEAGLRLRRGFGDWRIFATADFGREWIAGATEKPTKLCSLLATRRLGQGADLGLQWSYYQSSESPTNLQAADNYTWRMARAYLSWAF